MSSPAQPLVLNRGIMDQTRLTAAMARGQHQVAQMSSRALSGDLSSMQSIFKQFVAAMLPLVNTLLGWIDVIAPYAVQAWDAACMVYSYTPVNILQALYGLALCFFGGLYPLVALARCPLCARCMRIHLTRMSMHAHADHRSCGDVSGVGR